MKKYIAVVLILFVELSFGQTNKHIIWGIDLDSDWYSLTNYSAMSYFLVDTDSTDKDPYVITDFKYSHDKISKSFLDLGFDELLLGFPRGMQTKLQELKPDLFLARKTYHDINNYKIDSKFDISKSIDLLNQEFGAAELNMERDKYSVYKWKSVFSQIILTCREDELTSTIIYTKE